MNMGLWQIISTTDFISKCVLLLLLGMSIGCWALAFYKRMTINAKIKSLKQAQGLLQNTKNMDDFIARLSVIHSTFAGEFISKLLLDFKKLLRMYEHNPAPVSAIADKDWYLLQSNINERVEEALREEEYLLPVLSTSAQAAPLIGLFGTVWGLIHAFMGIAQQRSADISAVAPGIAEALITTMGGLVIAIPALLFFNYLQAHMKKFEAEVITVAENCLWIMRGVLVNDTVIKTAHMAKNDSLHKELL